MTVPGSPAVDYYYLHDHLYSPVALLSSDGSVVERYEYDAYGHAHSWLDAGPDRVWFTANDTVVDGGGSNVGNPYFFTGRRLDTLDNGNLALMYSRHRNHDTYTARFQQHDPLHYIDGMNLYEYVHSSPILYADPYGLFTIELDEVELGAYLGFGKSVSFSMNTSKKNCCKSGQLIKNGVIETDVSLRAHAGFGLGIKGKLIGRIKDISFKIPIDFLWEGPGVIGKVEGRFKKDKCLNSIEGGICFKIGADLAPKLDINLWIFKLKAEPVATFTLESCLVSKQDGLYGKVDLCFSVLGEDGVISFLTWKQPIQCDGAEPDCATVF